MNMESFYVSLLSDKAEYNYKSQSDFKTTLAKKINLKKENWETALVEIIIPSEIIIIDNTNDTFYLAVRNIKKKTLEGEKIVWSESLQSASDFSYKHLMKDILKENGIDIDLKREDFESRNSNLVTLFPAKIPHGGYININQFVNEINDIITNKFAQELRKKTGIGISLIYYEDIKRIKFKSNDNNHIGLAFEECMFEKLGGDKSKSVIVNNDKKYVVFFKDDKTFFKYNVDLNIGYNNLYIYSDIVDYTLVGDTESPLLRIIEYEQSNKINNNYHIEFQNYHYLPVSKSDFDEISILIRGDTGETIRFIKGITIIILHFRKKKNL